VCGLHACFVPSREVALPLLPPPFWTYVQEPFETHSPTIITTTTTTTTPFDLKKKANYR